MPVRPPAESELLSPVLALFEIPGYRAVLEARLSRKRIDVLLVPTETGLWISIELKVKDWKKALWQAAVNTQLSDHSYVALWHTTVKCALEQETLFKSYGVGIISVSATGAAVILEPTGLSSSTRIRQQELVLEELVRVKEEGEYLDTLSLLPA